MFIDQKTLLAPITADGSIDLIQLSLFNAIASLAMGALGFYWRGHRGESKKVWLSIPLSHSPIAAHNTHCTF